MTRPLLCSTLDFSMPLRPASTIPPPALPPLEALLPPPLPPDARRCIYTCQRAVHRTREFEERIGHSVGRRGSAHVGGRWYSKCTGKRGSVGVSSSSRAQQIHRNKNAELHGSEQPPRHSRMWPARSMGWQQLQGPGRGTSSGRREPVPRAAKLRDSMRSTYRMPCGGGHVLGPARQGEGVPLGGRQGRCVVAVARRLAACTTPAHPDTQPIGPSGSRYSTATCAPQPAPPPLPPCLQVVHLVLQDARLPAVRLQAQGAPLGRHPRALH